MLLHRVLSALIGIPLGLVVVWKGDLWLMGLVVVLALIGFQEFHRTLRRKQVEALREIGFPAVAALIAGAHFLEGDQLLLFLQGVLVVVVVASLAFHIVAPVDGSKLASAAATVLGVIYIGYLFSFFVLVRDMPMAGQTGGLPFGLRLFIVVLFATWGADTGAYAFGKTIGRHKLCPAVSPGKTIEGVLGGLLAAVLFGRLAGWWVGFPVDDAQALGGLCAVLGLVGDLSKSVIKRDIGVKDFGALIPGHGGVLDRFDSLLVNMPAAYFFALAVMR